MARKHWRILRSASCALALCAVPTAILSQGPKTQESASERQASAGPNVSALGDVIRQLQSQVGELSQQMKELRAEQATEREQNDQLRKDLDSAKAQIAALNGTANPTSIPSPSEPSAAFQAANTPQPQEEKLIGLSDRVERLEEMDQLTQGKFGELNQSRVESGAKYRLRLSGIVLFNSYVSRGSVDNQDIPEIARPKNLLSSNGTFGASLRQSQIGLDGFGPEIWGAKTSASVRFDFAGGFPSTPNGNSEGFVRLRTGVVRLDWENTSVIAGQDALFLSPITPTSIASLGVPALAYSGNLWSWAPQIRVEHTIHLGENSKLLVQGALLDNLSGDVPQTEYTRTATWGEQSGQPAYAVRIALTKTLFGQPVTIGAGGYYGRQDWGFGRNVDGWAGTADVALPVGKLVEFDGEFYRGRATGGLGGGIGQSVVWQGSLIDPMTEVYGLDSMGGWAQLKFKVTSKFQLNGALGLDNPFASELREFGGNTGYYGELLSKNLTPMVNFLYTPRSNIVLSLEYRHLKTYTLDRDANNANRVTMSIGYLF